MQEGSLARTVCKHNNSNTKVQSQTKPGASQQAQPNDMMEYSVGKWLNVIHAVTLPQACCAKTPSVSKISV